MAAQSPSTYDPALAPLLPVNVMQMGGTAVPGAALPPPGNIQGVSSGAAGIIQLFDMTTIQNGSSQKGKIFPATIAVTGTSLPTLGSGTIATLTNGGNVCGAVVAVDPRWDSVILDFIGVNGQASGKTATLEIGRVTTLTTLADILASVVFTTSTNNTGAITTNPITGATHASQNWTSFDATTITALSGLGDVLQATGGSTGNLQSRLKIACHDVGYLFFQVTAEDASFTELLAAITPTS